MLQFRRNQATVDQVTGLETYYFRNSQTFASGLNLNSQIVIPYSQLILLLFQRFIHPKCMQVYTFRNAK